MGFIKNLRTKYSRKTCYTLKSSKQEFYLIICSEIGAARIITPHLDKLIDASPDGDYKSALSPAFAEAYRLATDAGDAKLADEIHSIRQIVCF